nr:Rpn family recombination-promoting nuclease/putative transposase [Muribaculaceae bacterium]
MQEGMNGIVDPMTRDFIRVLTDFGFKRMFGSVEHAHLLLRFLNALFEGEMIIKSVEFRDKEVLPLQPHGKRVLYDIYCTTDHGDHFILEMQQVESENFAARILFYGSSAIIKQGIKGVEYKYSPVYCIVFTDFNLSGMSHTLIKDILLTDQYTGEVYTDLLRIMFISLPEVPKEWDECNTELLRILYLIKNMENMTRDSKQYKSSLYEEF